MNNKSIRVIIFILSFLIVGKIANAQFHAIYIPEERINKMKIDGNSSDWNWVPDKYNIRTEKMVDIISNSKPNEQNFNCRIIVGWNEIKNKIYLLAIVYDDIVNVKYTDKKRRFYLQDCLEFAFCSLDRGDFYKDFENNACKLHYIISQMNTKDELIFDVGPKWILEDNRFARWGCNRENNVTVFELELSLWNYWNNKGFLYSNPCYLESNMRIRLAVGFDDSDSDTDKFSQWITLSGTSWWRNTEDLSIFTLDPPMGGKVNWGDVKTVIESK